MIQTMRRFSTAKLMAAALLIGAAGGTTAAVFSRNIPVELYETEPLDSVEGRSELSRVLIAAGITPKCLAAAGVAPERVGAIIADAREYLAGPGSGLLAVLNNARDTRVSAQRLERRVASGVARPEERMAYSTAVANRDSARTGREAALDGFFQAACARLPQSSTTTLRNIHANRNWELPMQYLAVEPNTRTEAEWVALRDALAHVRICSSSGDTPNGDLLGIVTTANANSAVSAAAAGLQNLDAITSAWNNAIE